jgi:hypothetical protein
MELTQLKLAAFLGNEGSEKGTEKVASIPLYTPSSVPLATPRPIYHTKTVMVGHHLAYHVRYSGKQPFDNEARVNKLKNWNQHIWERNTYKIIAGTRSLVIVLEIDGGLSLVTEKLAFTRELATRIIATFARNHQLKLTTSVELSKHSHWVLAHHGLSAQFKPLCDKPGNKRVGALPGDGSHPDFVEFTGPDSAIGAEGIDGLTITLPRRLDALYAGMIAQRQDITIFMGAVGTLLDKLTTLIDKMDKTR